MDISSLTLDDATPPPPPSTSSTSGTIHLGLPSNREQQIEDDVLISEALKVYIYIYDIYII